MGLVAGDEYDPRAGRHQRHGQQRQAALGVAIESHRVSRIRAGFESARGVEDQHIQPAEVRGDVLHHRCDLDVVGDVGSQRGGIAARAPDGVDNRVGPLGFLAVVHDDVGIGRGELTGDFGADSS